MNQGRKGGSLVRVDFRFPGFCGAGDGSFPANEPERRAPARRAPGASVHAEPVLGAPPPPPPLPGTFSAAVILRPGWGWGVFGIAAGAGPALRVTASNWRGGKILARVGGARVDDGNQ